MGGETDQGRAQAQVSRQMPGAKPVSAQPGPFLHGSDQCEEARLELPSLPGNLLMPYPRNVTA